MKRNVMVTIQQFSLSQIIFATDGKKNMSKPSFIAKNMQMKSEYVRWNIDFFIEKSSTRKNGFICGEGERKTRKK